MTADAAATLTFLLIIIILGLIFSPQGTLIGLGLIFVLGLSYVLLLLIYGFAGLPFK